MQRRACLFLLLILLSFGLGSCNSQALQGSTPEATGVASTSPALSPEAPTPTVMPTVAPTVQPRAILLAPAGADPLQVSALQELMADLAQQAGLGFQTVQTLSSAEITPELRMVVALPPDPGLAALAGAAPGTKFIGVGIPGDQPPSNLQLVSLVAGRPDQQGFIAGYLASVVTPDWRVGVISTGDSPQGSAARQGFLNGVVYFCGLCRPAYPPFVQYPLSYDLPSGASQAEAQAAADALIAQGVGTVYVFPGAGDQALLEYLAQNGVNLIGGQTPPDNLKPNWIATIQNDWLASVEAAWNNLLSGQALDVPAGSLAITDRNETLFSPGRQRLVEQMLTDLSAGYIDTGVTP